MTRGQLSKIVVIAAGWTVINPPNPTFSDVPPNSTFYSVIETAVCRGVISGYSDGTFRPNNNAIRGQIAKIVYLALTGSVVCRPTPSPFGGPSGRLSPPA
ncbi:MAG: S-layer homology domain-containing protein [Chloroflexia bacterium]